MPVLGALLLFAAGVAFGAFMAASAIATFQRASDELAEEALARLTGPEGIDRIDLPLPPHARTHR